MPADAVIKTEKLTKYYGPDRGVVDLDLEVQRGEVYGFLGPNGAGKSTTINILLDFRRPSSGRAEVLGMDANQEATAIHRQVGFLAGELSLYDRLTGRELLRYLGSLRGLYDKGYVGKLAKQFQVELDRPIGTLSKGNKQKVGLLQAMAHRPEVLILDEPTSGLDPLAQKEFNDFLVESTGEGVTVFLSSHVLSEVEHICDRAAIVRNGRLIAVEDIAKLHERALRHLEVHFAKAAPRHALTGLKNVSDVKIKGHVLHADVRGDMDKVIKALARHDVTNLISEHASLEEIFFEAYGEESDA